MRRSISVKDIGLACSSAALLIACFPKLDLSAFAWVSLVPLLIALEGKTVKQSYLLTHLAGIVFHSGFFYWIWSVQGYNLFDYALLQLIYLPSYVSLWGLGLAWVRKRTQLPVSLIAPPLWVMLEYARAHAGFLRFPWALLGQSQYLHSELIQIASVTGVYGLSFLIVLVNSAIAELVLYGRSGFFRLNFARTWWRVPFASITTAVVLLIAIPIYGVSVMAQKTVSAGVRVALIQPNIPNQEKSDGARRQELLQKQVRLTRQAANERPQLIVWSETAVAGDVQHVPELRSPIAQLATEVKSYLLVGSSEHGKFTNRNLRGKFYNTMALFTPRGEIAGEYRKIELVPFGEYIPLRKYIAWPTAVVPEMADTLAGDKFTIFELDGIKFATTICWELIFPELFSQFVKNGAAFMTIATNEAWFGDTAAPHQLLAMSVLRAAENRVAIARAANTGVSAFIDPYGRITARVRGQGMRDTFTEGVLVGDVVISRTQTFYTRYGDVFALSQMLLFAVLILYAFTKATPNALAHRPL